MMQFRFSEIAPIFEKKGRMRRKIIPNKKESTCWLSLIFFLALTIFQPPASGQAASTSRNPLLEIRDIPLPGKATRLDYIAIDPKKRRLLIAHLGDSSLLVFSLVHRNVIKEIHKIPKIHGVISVPEKNAIFATATGVDKLFEISSKTLKVTQTFPSGHHPDGLAFDAQDNKVFISDETGHAITAVGTGSRRSISTIDLPGEVGNTRASLKDSLIYSTVSGEKGDMVAVIDPKRMKIIRKIPVDEGCKPHGERITPDGKQIFILCQEKATLLIMDLPSGKIQDRFPVGTDPDVLSLDPKRGHLVVASEAGIVSVFRNISGKWEKAGEQYVAYRAHTVAVDPETGLVYLPLQDVKGKPVLRIMKYEARDPVRPTRMRT